MTDTATLSISSPYSGEIVGEVALTGRAELKRCSPPAQPASGTSPTISPLYELMLSVAVSVIG